VITGSIGFSKSGEIACAYKSNVAGFCVKLQKQELLQKKVFSCVRKNTINVYIFCFNPWDVFF